MICPNCQSESGNYEEWWEEYWDGETEQSYLISYWDCNICQARVNHYDDGFIGGEND